MTSMTNELAFLSCYALIIAMKIVCFIIGYLIIRLGYNLISSGIKGEFKFSGKIGGYKADLVSASPGLLFVLLGVLLICYTIFVHKEIELKKSLNIDKPQIEIPNKLPQYK
jgi:hypothetical protein